MLCLFYKIVNGQAPIMLLNTFDSLNTHERIYNLRGNNIAVPFTRTESYRQSFFPEAIRQWNSLDTSVKLSKSLSEFKHAIQKPKYDKHKILYYGSRWPSIHHARLRLGCSKLKSHLTYNLHVLDDPYCTCGFGVEDPIHFFFTCPHYSVQRTLRNNTVAPITLFTLHNLLYGDNNLSLDENKVIFDAVHRFLEETQRFV